MKFVKVPNNPECASTVLIAKNAPQGVVEGLKKLNITPLFGDVIEYDVEAVKYHIDTQITHIGGNKFVVSPYLFDHYSRVLPEADLLIGNTTFTGTYPDDAAYNVASIGRFAIHNFKFTDKVVLSEIQAEKIHVSQGYSKCSLCIVDENSVITEDAGIAKTLKRHNIDVLKISAGDVRLNGLEYGFLGGASGKLSKNILAFAGDISSHRDYEEIRKFCIERNVEPISLCLGALTDIGSIIPVFEKEWTG